MGTILEAIGVNKWLAYMTLGLILLSSVSILFLKIRNGGKDAVRYEQARNDLEAMRQNAEIKLRIERGTSASARERLRNKYAR